jgi:hypothetical protein
MRLHILNYDLELRSIAEANVQQAFVDILDNDVINPLVSLKVSQGVFVHVDNLIMIGPSGRKREIKRESGWRRISRDLLQIMPIMQRTQSRFYSRHTSRNITLGNVLTSRLFSTFSSQDILNKRFEVNVPVPFGGRREISRALDPAKSEAGATGITVPTSFTEAAL